MTRYVKVMSPMVTVTERNPETWIATKYLVPITYWYEHYFLVLISTNDDKTKKYKEELFGPGHVEATPMLYGDYSMLDAINRSEDEFAGWSLHARARTIAYRHNKGLVELREHHMRIMKDRIERRNRGSSDKPSKQT